MHAQVRTAMKASTFYLLFRNMRPKQWTKNAIIFAPLLFSQNFLKAPLVLETFLACAVFCVLSGAVYIINDLLDIEQDRRHPLKCTRPLASGLLKPRTAVLFLIALLVGSALFAVSFLNWQFVLLAACYLVLQLSYSIWLKHVVIIDVFCIASGFLLRVAAGAVAIEVTFSTWLFFCTILLALFLALSKRRHELVLLEDGAAEHRRILYEYSTDLLDQMISIVTTATLIAYILYTVSAETVAKFGSDKLKYTIPFVLYGIFRYLYLIHQKNEGGSPEKALLNDRPILLTVVLYGLAVCAVLLYMH
jgi:4-hydroxybenzoate polyprenyltransferase